MQRRDFLKLSATASAVTMVTACSSDSDPNTPDLPDVPDVPDVPDNPDLAGTHYSACLVNCGSNCPIKVHTNEDGHVTQIETDHQGEDQYGSHQVKACVRGRALKQRTYAPDRLKAPMKRVGKRGEGKFEEISWDEAFAHITGKVSQLANDYGNQSIYFHYGTGSYYGFHSNNAIKRAINLGIGGHLRCYSNYSWAQINAATPATLGQSTQSGTYLSEVEHSDLFLGFGFNPMEIRMSGSGEQYDFLKALERNRKNIDIVMVDPRYTDTAVNTVTGKETQWMPVRPGTDAALAEAIAYEMIHSGWVEANSKAFLDSHCLGYDRASLERLITEIDSSDEHPLAKYRDLIDPAENYQDYILGEGQYQLVRTPEWAAEITGLSAAQIRKLAKMIMDAEAPYISVGAGCNRHACGEQTVRSLYMLPILTGKIGQAGVNSGPLPRNYGRGTSGSISQGDNNVKETICFFTWAEAIENGENMTNERHGVNGLSDDAHERDENGHLKFGTNIKAVFSANGNALINQHSDINKTRAILEDESKCELIVVVDCWMTASAKFADILLPDTTWLETDDLAGDSYASGQTGYVTFMKGIPPMYNCRNMWEMGHGLAKAWGVEAAFTEGKTEQQLLEEAYQATRERNSDWDLPESYAEAQKLGFKRHYASGFVALEEFRSQGPQGEWAQSNMRTPSKKIEIFSLDWADKATRHDPLSDQPYDQITPLPQYTETWAEQDKEEYPFHIVAYHTKGRTHSSYHNVDWLREAVEDAAWINPQDAAAQGVSNGSTIVLESPDGAIELRAKITPRVMPGVVGLAQGAWYQGNQAGAVDKGGCINTLTRYHPTPVAKGNPQHTIRVKIRA
ncbi:DMSO/selenate family reductase complex A subunit [Ferrimonas marina]|uniref:Anaerobic dimethyl sulfoxide reductase subunit A n=1 Tax=Ferrimonas marina TaxID=299255 RepID=A0A1M5XVC7_9GAMM|nr:DMSO/selenate family reductase complex A subunit [Ferrimonas marina]SHI03478.1 anaerobic dimethyl sulfoxide reductase subunit A [Ferrimonas marina]